MNILVLNGSPKGENSITLQTVYYLEKKYHIEHLEVFHVGARIKALEKDFSPALEAVERADILIFSYPVYTFIAPCQMHRFIELLKEHKAKVEGCPRIWKICPPERVKTRLKSGGRACCGMRRGSIMNLTFRRNRHCRLSP